METVWVRCNPTALATFTKKHARLVTSLFLAMILSWGLVHWSGWVGYTFSSVFHCPSTTFPALKGKPRPTGDKSILAPLVIKPLTSRSKASYNRFGEFGNKPGITNAVSCNYLNHLLQIVIDSERNQRAVITILDQFGRPVCNVYQGPWIAGHHVISWSGKDTMGNAVLPGKYMVVVQVNGQTTSSVFHFPDF